MCQDSELTPLKKILISAYKDEMVSFFMAHPEYFDEGILLALSNHPTFGWRSAWLVNSCMKKDDKRIQPYVVKIFDELPNRKQGHIRELLKILLKMNLNEDQKGMAFEVCAEIWKKIDYKPSVRYNALVLMLEIASEYEELLEEIKFLTQKHFLETLSPGVKRGVLKMILK